MKMKHARRIGAVQRLTAEERRRRREEAKQRHEVLVAEAPERLREADELREQEWARLAAPAEAEAEWRFQQSHVEVERLMAESLARIDRLIAELTEDGPDPAIEIINQARGDK